MKLKYNLQFFAEEQEKETEEQEKEIEIEIEGDEFDPSAFADIISEKDKQIAELQKDMAKLKKSNAELLVKVSAGAGNNTEKTYEENLLELVGAKPRKE